MGLESATFIENLNINNPEAVDAISQADDHLRLIKTVLKASFPNINAAVTAVPAELNKKTAIISDGAGQLTFNTNVTQALMQTLLGIIKPALSIDGSTLSIDSGTTAADIRTALGVSSTSILDVYPVGSVYIGVDSSFDIEGVFGGSWTRISQGKVLVGHDDSGSPDADFDTTEETGGTKTHQLTIAQMPAHSHTVAGMEQVVGDSVNTTGSGQLGQSATITSSTVGQGQAFSKMPPYLVVCMWKRTA